MRTLLVLLAFTLAASRATAAEPVELAAGVNYLRITAYTEDSARLATALVKDGALIVDLRYPAEEGAAQFPLVQLLTQAAGKRQLPLYILVSPQTPTHLADALRTLPRGALTLGIKDSVPAPGVVVAQTAEADRRAFDAGANGQFTALISGKLEKERFDEATLVKEFKNGNPNAAPPPEPDVTAGDATKKEPPPPLSDRVLQRALHLHRALLALRTRG